MREPLVKLVLATMIMLFGFVILPTTPAESSTCCSHLSEPPELLQHLRATTAYTSCAMRCPGCPF